MDRYIPYIKIAVCTQNPGVNDTIREYAAGFEVRAGVKIQVDIMKNCYPLAKKILDREHYDVICLGRKLWDIDSYTFASSIRMTDQETIFLLLGWDRLTLPQIEKVAPVAYLHTPLQKEEFRKELYRVLSRLGPDADTSPSTRRAIKAVCCIGTLPISAGAEIPCCCIP